MSEIVSEPLVVGEANVEGDGVTLVASRAGAEVGRLVIAEVSPTVWQVRAAEAPRPEVRVAFAEYVEGLVPADADVLIRDTPDLVQGRQVLEVMGRAPVLKKAFAQRDLSDVTAPDVAGWQFRSLARQPRAEFVRSLVACAAGDPFPSVDVQDPDSTLQEWIDLAGPLFDPAGWVSVHDGRGLVGVVLPQVYWDLPGEGSLFYIGVAPGRRGQQLGTRLHRWGLTQLRQRGADRYVGSTDLGNTGMLGVFARNGCTLTHQQWFYQRVQAASD